MVRCWFRPHHPNLRGAEHVADKDDLLRATDLIKLGISQAHPSFRIGGYTFGAALDIWNRNKVSLAFGGEVTFSLIHR